MADELAKREVFEPKISLRWTRGNTRELVIGTVLAALCVLVLASGGALPDVDGTVSTMSSFVSDRTVFTRAVFAWLVYVCIASFQELFPVYRQHHQSAAAATVELLGFCFFVVFATGMVIWAAGTRLFHPEMVAENNAMTLLLFAGIPWLLFMFGTGTGRTFLLNALTGLVLARVLTLFW